MDQEAGIAAKEQKLSFPSKNSHRSWMKHALRLAENAFSEGEVPVGAIVVKEGRIVGRGYNQREGLNDPTAHAEIIAITAASGTLNDWRLEGCSLYVTKEPCSMCAGAIIQARVRRVVFGARDPRGGAVGSLANLLDNPLLNHKCHVTAGVLEAPSRTLLQSYFSERRGDSP